MRALAPRGTGLVLVAPALVVLATVTACPALWVVWLSLQRRVPIFGIAEFEGLRNYVYLAADPRFWSAARVTLIFTVVWAQRSRRISRMRQARRWP